MADRLALQKTLVASEPLHSLSDESNTPCQRCTHCFSSRTSDQFLLTRFPPPTSQFFQRVFASSAQLFERSVAPSSQEETQKINQKIVNFCAQRDSTPRLSLVEKRGPPFSTEESSSGRRGWAHTRSGLRVVPRKKLGYIAIGGPTDEACGSEILRVKEIAVLLQSG